jgi:hypothetical protein
MDRVPDDDRGAPQPVDAHVVHLHDGRRALVDAVTAHTGCGLLHGEGDLPT